LGLIPRPLTAIDGLNYTTGRRLHLVVYGAAADGARLP